MTSITARQHRTDEASTSTVRMSINGSVVVSTLRSWPIDLSTMESRELGLLLRDRR
jgi:hypothetical protein